MLRPKRSCFRGLVRSQRATPTPLNTQIARLNDRWVSSLRLHHGSGRWNRPQYRSRPDIASFGTAKTFGKYQQCSQPQPIERQDQSNASLRQQLFQILPQLPKHRVQIPNRELQSGAREIQGDLRNPGVPSENMDSERSGASNARHLYNGLAFESFKSRKGWMESDAGRTRQVQAACKPGEFAAWKSHPALWNSCEATSAQFFEQRQ